MKHYFSMIVVALLLCCNSFSLGWAETASVGKEKYHFDNSHTNVMWFANHIGFSNSMGQFMEFDGEIILDHDNPEQSAVNITLKTESVMTGLPKFDDHLRSSDFFDVEKFPTAKFKSTKVTLLGDNKALVEGDFTMLGISKPVTLKVRLNKRALDISKNIYRSGFTVQTTITRSKWGMKKYLPLIGDHVKIKIEAEALRVE